MLKGHSLSIKPNPNFMLKRHSLSEVPKRVSCFTLPMRPKYDFMLKGHSLPIMPNPNFMLKRQSLPIVKKSFMLKGHTCQWFKISIFMLKCLCIEIFDNFLLADMKDG